MFWKWDQSCNFRQFPIWSSDAFVGEYSLVDLSWHHEVVLTFGGDQVKAMCMIQDKYERRFLFWTLPRNKQCLFREEVVLNPLAKSYAASQMSEVQAWVRDTHNEAKWVEHMSAREELFWKPFAAQMRSILAVWTPFNSCTQALCPEVKDSIVEKLIDTV